MRNLLTILLIITTWTTYGQSKTLLGKYTQSFFMYNFSLTLSDSGKFKIDEYSDMGTKTTVGIWTINKDTLKLTPTKLYLWDRRNPEKEKREFPPNINEILISVDSKQRLKIISPKGTDMTYKDKELDKVQ